MNKSAFPHPKQILKDDAPGLTKRELFAALALQGLCTRDLELFPGGRAYVAVKEADALIKELEKEKA